MAEDPRVDVLGIVVDEAGGRVGPVPKNVTWLRSHVALRKIPLDWMLAWLSGSSHVQS
jgi:hypothetical protein